MCGNVTIRNSSVSSSNIIVSGDKKKSWQDNILLYIIITFALGLTLNYLTNVLWEESMKNETKVNIENSSLANTNILVDSPGSTVNVNQAWDLNDEMKSEIDRVLKNHGVSSVKIIHLNGDGDSGRMAYQLKDYLISRNVTVGAFYANIPSGEIYEGIKVFPDSFGPGPKIFTFYIGRKP